PFNGAAASTPRKRAGHLHISVLLRSFNGAAASTPRKQPLAEESRRIEQRLQWSRGIYAAETGGRRRGVVAGGPLQWSRGIYAAETACGSGRGGGGASPSMEPRHLRRGNHAHRQLVDPLEAPSMEPRHLRRGNPRRCATWGWVSWP